MAGTARGQASLEYLAISLVALALVSVSAFALTGIRGYAERASGDFSFRASALSLANAISGVCALGSGNGRSVVLEAPVSVEYSDSMVRISGGDGASLVRPAKCGISVRGGYGAWEDGALPGAAGGLSGLVYVKNEDGNVILTAR
jgi:hypothetical protein